MNNSNTNIRTLKFIKLLTLIAVILLLIFLSIKLFPLFLNLGSNEGQIIFKEKIKSSGFGGILTLLGLQLLQILVPILPGEPIEFLSGMCYGTLGGMLIVFLGAFLSSFVIFYCVRKFGRSFIYTFFGKDKIENLENSKWFSNPNKIELFLLIVFFIPGTPKDLFVYISGLLPVRPSRFFIISTFARFPSIISSTFAGANLVDGNWKISILSYVITFAISAVCLWFYNKKENI